MTVTRWSVAVVSLILVALTSPVIAQSDVRRLNVEWREAYDAKKWDVAKEISGRLIASEPKSPVHPYNLACVLALSGDKDGALVALRRSVELGFPDAKLFAEDPDLASLRDTDAYRQGLATLRENLARQKSEFAAAMKKSPIKVVLPRGYDSMEKARVIIALHPFGGTADWIARQWREVADEFGAIIVAPQAVYRQGNGYQWGDTSEADAIFQRAYALLGSLKADRDQVVLTGFSQGAFMTFNLGMKHCEKFVGVIPVAGQYDPAMARPSGTSAKPKYVMLAGTEDRVIGSNRLAAEQYKAAGISVRLEAYEGLGHAFPEDRVKELAKALSRIWK